MIQSYLSLIKCVFSVGIENYMLLDLTLKAHKKYGKKYVFNLK